MENLLGLGGKVILANRRAFFIERGLARDEEETTRFDLDDLGIARGWPPGRRVQAPCSRTCSCHLVKSEAFEHASLCLAILGFLS
jgi:hypothetical protein